MVEWVLMIGNIILDNVICVGYDINKKVLFIVWVVVLGEMIFGKCGIYFEGVYIFFVGKEYIIQNYEVLVYLINVLGFLDW